MADILDKIIADKRIEVAERKAATAVEQLIERATDLPRCRNFYRAVTKSNPRGLNVTDGKAKSSSLYAWYQADFGGADGVIRHLAAAGGPEVAARLGEIEKISSHSYDWALIDAQK